MSKIVDGRREAMSDASTDPGKRITSMPEPRTEELTTRVSTAE
jgi:hypothetical protein